MRKSTGYLIVLTIGGICFIFLHFVHPQINKLYYNNLLAANKRMVKELQLTDLCLFTEARYTRHLSQADLHSAFQDHPMSFEHFPSGSLVLPPPVLRK